MKAARRRLFTTPARGSFPESAKPAYSPLVQPQPAHTGIDPISGGRPRTAHCTGLGMLCIRRWA